MKRFLTILFAAAALVGCEKNHDDDSGANSYMMESFENVDNMYLAGPTPRGENLYADYDGEQITKPIILLSGLSVKINADEDGKYNFHNGGIALSRWNVRADTPFVTANSLENQCSVYSPKGGYNTSNIFAIVYYSSYNSSNPPALSFTNPKTERVFDRFWVMNSTYAALTMKDGNAFARALTFEDKDWLKLTISGYDKNDKKTGDIEFYLADFRTPESGGIVTEWTKVDLSRLGRVNRIEFTITGSDMGEWGLNTPSYFCFDDVLIRMPNSK